jgi:hypothetical protein
MKNICFIKKAALGSLVVVPITATIGYLIYLSVAMNVELWPFYNAAPLGAYLLFYTILSILALISTFLIYEWMLLTMMIGNWIKSKLDK